MFELAEVRARVSGLNNVSLQDLDTMDDLMPFVSGITFWIVCTINTISTSVPISIGISIPRKFL